MSELPYLRNAGATARASDADATETKSSRVARDALCAPFPRTPGNTLCGFAHGPPFYAKHPEVVNEQRSRPFAWVMNQESVRIIRTG